MSDQDNLSRRDLLRTKLLGRFLSKAADTVIPETPDPQSAPTSVGKLMRYPVTANDLPTNPNARSGFHRSIPVLRPPGAVNEERFLQDCTRCNACLEACPHDAIVHAPVQFRAAAGTPMINTAKQPCMMCDDLPCITACEPGVLTNLLPPVMGTARITPETCMAHQGSFCTVCSEQCPVQNAITIQNGKPTINEDACTGCGVCQYVCPAPENAVLIMPALTRPTAPSAPPPPQDNQTNG